MWPIIGMQRRKVDTSTTCEAMNDAYAADEIAVTKCVSRLSGITSGQCLSVASLPNLAN